MTTSAVAACAGFLLGVLWMDLMFDSQVRSAGSRSARLDSSGPLDAVTLASIAGYYRRATTTSQPRGLLIAVAMVTLLGSLGLEAVRGDLPGWLMLSGFALAGGPILLALLHTVPAAVRLGRRVDGAAEQSRLAFAVYRDHRICLACMAAFLALRLVAGLSSN